jgi:predicted DNA-binding protein
MAAQEQKTETMDTLLSIPMYPKYDQPLKVAAQRDGRTVAAYVRWVILQDLEVKGLVDVNKEPITPEGT